MIRTALALAEKGLRVFPCKPRGKLPATEHGCLDATIDRAVIEGWWSQVPDYNVAIATGAASRVFVVDVDGPDAEAELKKLEAAHGGVPPSVEAITARGRHVYFKWPDRPVRNSASKVAPGIDVRGDGGYVLAPPSMHPTGRRYAWSVDSASSFATPPEWLLAKVAEPANGRATPAALPASEWRALVCDGVTEGARDCTATRVAGHLLRRRVDPFIVLELLQAWNTRRCIPPLPERDVERIVESIAMRELQRREAPP